MPRRVSFGATPAPYRSPDPCTRSGSSLKTAELQQRFVPAGKMKTMADLDKEEEARMTKTYKEKAKKGALGVVDWLGRKITGGGGKKD
ncbi:uncharacterized protein EKO05_0006599 [Ascochyta rabiei]|uniref:uncharacterized protein n=1 Tax=Didymella rabiei TaxID=5454 RepID=UPI00220C80EA|nr:uncharacterized protein EKO05_0006599 [Ascochyta rabiei]UPX16184.1 hypothetical protein EKO05_0006599 [Ascochyta rabiei]